MFQCSLSMLFPQGILVPMLLALSTGGGYPTSIRVSQQVDLIELNHCHDDAGRHCYDQVVFYEWSPDYRRYHVVAWCLVDNGLSRMPMFDHPKQQYVVRWYDRESGRDREIWSPLFRETWSNSDPERANKKLMEEKYRVSLLRKSSKPALR